jgi:Holliday junction resolvase
MSGASPGNKGKRGERELMKQLNKQFGGPLVERTGYQQSRKQGGFDLTMPNCSIEVKRYAKIKDGHIRAFWDETVEQSKEFGTVGVLAYREDNQAWRFVVPGSFNDENGTLQLIPELKYTWTLWIDGFTTWYLSTLAGDRTNLRVVR